MAFLMVRSTYGIKGFSVIGKILMNRNIVFMPSWHKFVDMLAIQILVVLQKIM